jgi:hypothetical protein
MYDKPVYSNIGGPHSRAASGNYQGHSRVHTSRAEARPSKFAGQMYDKPVYSNIGGPHSRAVCGNYQGHSQVHTSRAEARPSRFAGQMYDKPVYSNIGGPHSRAASGNYQGHSRVHTSRAEARPSKFAGQMYDKPVYSNIGGPHYIEYQLNLHFLATGGRLASLRLPASPSSRIRLFDADGTVALARSVGALEAKSCSYVSTIGIVLWILPR